MIFFLSGKDVTPFCRRDLVFAKSEEPIIVNGIQEWFWYCKKRKKSVGGLGSSLNPNDYIALFILKNKYKKKKKKIYLCCAMIFFFHQCLAAQANKHVCY